MFTSATISHNHFKTEEKYFYLTPEKLGSTSKKHSGKQKMENTVYTSMEKRLNRGNLDADSAKFTPILGLTTKIAYLM